MIIHLGKELILSIVADQSPKLYGQWAPVWKQFSAKRGDSSGLCWQAKQIKTDFSL